MSRSKYGISYAMLDSLGGSYGFTDSPLDRDTNVRAEPAEDVASAWKNAVPSFPSYLI